MRDASGSAHRHKRRSHARRGGAEISHDSPNLRGPADVVTAVRVLFEARGGGGDRAGFSTEGERQATPPCGAGGAGAGAGAATEELRLEPLAAAEFQTEAVREPGQGRWCYRLCATEAVAGPALRHRRDRLRRHGRRAGWDGCRNLCGCGGGFAATAAGAAGGEIGFATTGAGATGRDRALPASAALPLKLQVRPGPARLRRAG